VILVPLLLVLLLAQSLTVASLGATAAVARLSGDRRAAVEASAALETAIARARVQHSSELAAVPPGSLVVLPVTGPPGWETTATARRESGSELVYLEVRVLRRGVDGVPLAGRRGTLLLELVAADTAIVIGSRPGF
jgi:hypothetical protein